MDQYTFPALIRPNRKARPAGHLAILIALLLSATACTSVHDLWADEVLEVAVADGGDEDGSGSDLKAPDIPIDLGLEECDPDPCLEIGRECIGGFCGECLPGFVENASGICEASAGPCDPDPCLVEHRDCLEGICGPCSIGHVENSEGVCVSTGDPCLPDPCEAVHKTCLEGFCDKCLPGFFEDVDGQCSAPVACFPNPCTEPLRTTCAVAEDGSALCLCDAGTHENEAGECTFDPCDPDPCTEPTTKCTFTSPVAECQCPDGALLDGASCVIDPCEPNPCDGYARTTCVYLDGGGNECACDWGFIDGPDGCVEGPVQNLTSLPEPEGVIVIGHEWHGFADDAMVADRTGFSRKVHPLTMHDATWTIGPDFEAAFIGQSRAAGSLVQIPAAVRNDLPNGHPLKPFGWRLYYMGFRQPYVLDPQPSWMCIAAASSPQGPWFKPLLDVASPQPNCTLRVDGLVVTEVTLRDFEWTLSAARLPLGTAQEAPGVYVYQSQYGIFWEQAADAPVLGTALSPAGPSAYARVGTESRLVYDEANDTFVGFVSLVSPALGNARGVIFGGNGPASGWEVSPDPVKCPGILGPSGDDIIEGSFLGDMVVWREGSSFLGLVQKIRTDCASDEVFLATSRDGRHWVPVEDELTNTWPPLVNGASLSNVAAINSLSGGRPGESEDTWHFFFGASELGICDGADSPGGIIRGTVRKGGLVGLVPEASSLKVMVTRPLLLAPGLSGKRLILNVEVNDKLVIQVEKLSPINTIIDAAEGVVTQGSYGVVEAKLPGLVAVTDGVFRVRLSFTAGGELFAFRVADPFCQPNPCAGNEGKSGCAEVDGEAVCVCDPPLHDDGEGGCTNDPCLPDPCSLPHQSGCTAVEGEATCGCEEGWVPTKAVCIADPCDTVDGSNPCAPLQCTVTDGAIACFCPEGSEETPAGCLETDPRAFVTTSLVTAEGIQGISGADSLCAIEAAAHGLPGAYGAWLSTTEAPAISRFEGGGPWRTYDETYGLWVKLVATNASDLGDGTLVAPLNRKPSGLETNANCAVWTGTTPKGFPAPPVGNIGGSCDGWTSNAPGTMALAGQCHAADEAWTAAGPRSCAESLALYCLQLPQGGPDPPADPEE